MNRDTVEVIAVWTVFVVPFLVLIGYLHWRGQLTLEVIVIYWFPAVVLAVIGTTPAPWKPLTS